MQEKLEQLRLEKDQIKELFKARDEMLKIKEEELERRGREKEKLQMELKEFKPTMTCLVGAGPGPDGKHTALEAVTIVLNLAPGSMSGLTSIDRVSTSDPKLALALQRLVQAAVWFLGENANYAASEYAWESATPPGTALRMLDADKMVAAASSRNPTLASEMT